MLRAIHASPSLVDELIALAASPLTPERARERVEELRGDAGVSMVRAYIEIGSAANALTLLVALTEALVEALDSFIEILPSADKTSGGAAEEGAGGATGGTVGISTGASASGGWEDSEELRTVEGMPAAGTLAALWRETLGKPGACRLSDEEELEELLQNTQVARGRDGGVGVAGAWVRGFVVGWVGGRGAEPSGLRVYTSCIGDVAPPRPV